MILDELLLVGGSQLREQRDQGVLEGHQVKSFSSVFWDITLTMTFNNFYLI